MPPSYLSNGSKLSRYIFMISILAFFLITENSQAALSSLGNDVPPSFSRLAEEVKYCVVNISTTQVLQGRSLQPFWGPESPFRDFFGDEFFKRFFGDIPHGELRTYALGSGFVISQDGFILTNNHVIEKATQIKVKLHSGKEYDAQVVGADPKTDLALIRVRPDASFPRSVRMGDSAGILVGDWVMAVGNPFGLGHSVTVGIISAKGRIIGAGPYDDFLQTDAAINPGNSGGPLFNMKGEVIGINTAIIAQGQNIGFATPINTAKDLLSQLKSGKIIRGWLGVMIQDMTPELAKSFDLKEAKGALIADVMQGSPAEMAGLRRADIVLRLKGKEVENAHTLSSLVAAIPPDSRVTFDIIRNGKEKSVNVTIGMMPQPGEEATRREETLWGLTVQNLTPQLAERLGLDPSERGVVISDVEPGGSAAEAGLQPGDLIKEVDRQVIKNLADYTQATEKAEKSEGLLLLLKRGGSTLYVALKPPSKQ